MGIRTSYLGIRIHAMGIKTHSVGNRTQSMRIRTHPPVGIRTFSLTLGIRTHFLIVVIKT